MSEMISCKQVDEPYIAWNYSHWATFLLRKMYMPISILLGVVSCKSWP